MKAKNVAWNCEYYFSSTPVCGHTTYSTSVLRGNLRTSWLGDGHSLRNQKTQQLTHCEH